ncbi:MAG: hypothetical protein IJE87_07885, partial [Firmicutes bacterium]|nr:hypothetical protein [Bacillota bacterium]
MESTVFERHFPSVLIISKKVIHRQVPTENTENLRWLPVLNETKNLWQNEKKPVDNHRCCG